MPSRIFALWCWYHGQPFRGYQSQPLGPTVQDTLVKALRSTGVERSPVAAGRTDLGVHARMQVVSLRVDAALAPDALAGRLNAELPPGLGIALCRQAPADFHPQWKAETKEYRYRLLTADDERWAPCGWRVEVDVAALRRLLGRALGTHDFWAFHEKSSGRRPRTIRRLEVVEAGPGRLEVRVVGDGFARYMVRYLVGSAVKAARGEIAEEAFIAGVEAAVEFAGFKAPASGLVLWEVGYPAAFEVFSAEERRLAAGVPPEPPFT